METKRGVKMNEEETLLNDAVIDVITVCLKCHERWCTLDEYSKILACENCGNKSEAFFNYFCDYEDVITYLKKVK